MPMDFKESEIDEEIERMKKNEFKDLNKFQDQQNKAWGCYYLTRNKLLTEVNSIWNLT
jgi:hypothetical protein